MKSIFTVVALATSLSALACPQLAGEYTCSYTDNDQTVQATLFIGQMNVAGQERFLVESEDSSSTLNSEFYTVGSATDSGETAVCRGNSLRISSSGSVMTIRKVESDLLLTTVSDGSIQNVSCTPVI